MGSFWGCSLGCKATCLDRASRKLYPTMEKITFLSFLFLAGWGEGDQPELLLIKYLLSYGTRNRGHETRTLGEIEAFAGMVNPSFIIKKLQKIRDKLKIFKGDQKKNLTFTGEKIRVMVIARFKIKTKYYSRKKMIQWNVWNIKRKSKVKIHFNLQFYIQKNYSTKVKLKCKD